LTNWRGIWAVFVGGLVAGAYMTKVPPALPQLRAELELSLVESTFIVTTFNVLGMLVGMLAGMLGDRYGRKRLALTGLGLLAAGGIGGALVSGFLPLLASRFVEGVGFILFAVPAPALMSAMAADPRERAKALSIWSAYMPTGGTIALLAAPLFIAAWSWRALWLALAATAAAAAILVARSVPPTPRSQVSSLRLVVESVAQPGNIAMALLFAFYVAQWTSVMVWLPTFLAEHGMSTAAASVATALMVLVNAPGNLLGGPASKVWIRRSKRRAIDGREGRLGGRYSLMQFGELNHYHWTFPPGQHRQVFHLRPLKSPKKGTYEILSRGAVLSQGMLEEYQHRPNRTPFDEFLCRSLTDAEVAGFKPPEVP